MNYEGVCRTAPATPGLFNHFYTVVPKWWLLIIFLNKKKYKKGTNVCHFTSLRCDRSTEMMQWIEEEQFSEVEFCRIQLSAVECILQFIRPVPLGEAIVNQPVVPAPGTHAAAACTALWVWESALAPRGSSFKNAKLERRRATTSYPTKNKLPMTVLYSTSPWEKTGWSWLILSWQRQGWTGNI